MCVWNIEEFFFFYVEGSDSYDKDFESLDGPLYSSWDLSFVSWKKVSLKKGFL